jgi:hypothetical protein
MILGRMSPYFNEKWRSPTAEAEVQKWIPFHLLSLGDGVAMIMRGRKRRDRHSGSLALACGRTPRLH